MNKPYDKSTETGLVDVNAPDWLPPQPEATKNAVEPKKRPKAFDEVLARAVIQGLECGYMLEEMTQAPEMPSTATFRRWLDGSIPGAYAGFADDFARAEVICFDMIAHQARETARGIGYRATGDTQRDKLIIDTDMRILAKLSKKYSDNVTLRGDKENPLNAHLNMTVNLLDVLSLEQLEAIKQRALESGTKTIDVTPSVVN